MEIRFFFRNFYPLIIPSSRQNEINIVFFINSNAHYFTGHPIQTLIVMSTIICEIGFVFGCFFLVGLELGAVEVCFSVHGSKLSAQWCSGINLAYYAGGTEFKSHHKCTWLCHSRLTFTLVRQPHGSPSRMYE